MSEEQQKEMDAMMKQIDAKLKEMEEKFSSGDEEKKTINDKISNMEQNSKELANKKIEESEQGEFSGDYEGEAIATIDIKVESDGIVYEEHRYYQAMEGELILNISISRITEDQVLFMINTCKEYGSDKSELIPVKLNEEKVVEVGMYEPYIMIYRIRVSDIRYEIIKDL